MHAGGNPVSHGRRVDGDQNHHGGLCWEHSCAGGGVPCPRMQSPPQYIHDIGDRQAGRWPPIQPQSDTAPNPRHCFPALAGAYQIRMMRGCGWAVVTGGGHPEAPKVGGGLLAAGAMPVRFGGVSGRHVAHPCCPPVLACTRGTNAQPFMPKCFGCGERGLEGRSTDPSSAVKSFGDFLMWVIKACGGG